SLRKRTRSHAGDASPEERPRKVLAWKRLAARATPPSLLFQLDSVQTPDVEDVPRLTLISECEHTADEVFQHSLRGRPLELGHVVDQAVTFLVHFLLDGEQLTTDVNAAAHEAGLSNRTIERARDKLNVVA